MVAGVAIVVVAFISIADAVIVVFVVGDGVVVIIVATPAIVPCAGLFFLSLMSAQRKLLLQLPYHH